MSRSLWHSVRVAIRDRDEAAIAKLPEEIAAARPPLSPPVKNALEAQLRQAKGDEAGARRLLIGASKKRPLDPHEKLILGLLLIEDAPKARKLFGAAAKAGLRDPRIPEGLGATMVDMGDLDEGLKMLARAVKDDPKSWSARFAQAMALARRGDHEAALAGFEKVAKLRPDFEPAWLGFAAQSIAVGKAAFASQVLGPLVKKLPGRDKLMLAYVDCLVHAGDLKKALAAFTLLANRSRDVGLLADYVELCLQGGFLEPAAKTIDKIEHIDPKFPRGWLLRGKLGEQSEPRDVRGAIAAYEAAMKMDPSYLRAHVSLARVLMLESDETDFARAATLLEGVLAADDGELAAVALANLALLRLREEKAGEARRLARAAFDHRGSTPAAKAQAKKILDEA